MKTTTKFEKSWKEWQVHTWQTKTKVWRIFPQLWSNVCICICSLHILYFVKYNLPYLKYGQYKQLNKLIGLLLEYFMFCFLVTVFFAVYIIGPHYHNWANTSSTDPPAKSALTSQNQAIRKVLNLKHKITPFLNRPNA